MLITLFTDAGYCDKTNLASWAIWAKFNGQTLRAAGVFKELQTGSEVAEIKAIINGVYLARKKFITPFIKPKILIQTDCKVAIEVLVNRASKRVKKKKELNELNSIFKNTIKDLRFEFRWVQAHQGTITPRNAVNTFCDEQCSLHLNKARDELRKNLLIEA